MHRAIKSQQEWQFDGIESWQELWRDSIHKAIKIHEYGKIYKWSSWRFLRECLDNETALQGKSSGAIGCETRHIERLKFGIRLQRRRHNGSIRYQLFHLILFDPHYPSLHMIKRIFMLCCMRFYLLASHLFAYCHCAWQGHWFII